MKDSAGKNVNIDVLLDNPDEKSYLYDMITGSVNSYTNAFVVRANNREYYSKGIQSALGYSFETGEWKHKIDLGIRYHYDLMDRYQWDDQYKMLDGVLMQTKAGVPGTESNAIADALARATYVQYQLKYKKLTVTPGLRFEKIKLTSKNYGKKDTERTGADLIPAINEVEAYIPGIGIDYKFNQYFNVFTGVHKGFAPPGTLEGTKPEESINAEIGFMVSKNVFTTKVVGFYTDYINLLGSDMQAGGGAGTIDLYNGGAAQTQGIEFMVTYDFLSKDYSKYRLPLTVAYTYTDAFFKSSFISDFGDWGTVTSGDKLPYIAPHQLAANLSFETVKYSITIGGRYLDKMRTVAGSGAIKSEESINSYFIIDLSAAYKIHKNVSLFGSVANLANEVYVVARRPSGLRPGMPQMFIAGIKASF
jgi:Fe(3+) dicitrate transport protein